MQRRIAIVTPYSACVGGVEVVTLRLAEALSFHDVDVLSLDGIYPITLKEKLRHRVWGHPSLVKPSFQTALSDYDVVICNGEYGFGIHHHRCINLFHGSALGYLQAIAPYISLKQKLQLRRCQVLQRLSARNKTVIAVAESLRFVLKMQGIAVDHVIPNAVDTESFVIGPTADHNGRCLFVGRMDVYGKGMDRLVNLAKAGIPIDCLSDVRPPSPLNWIGTLSHDQVSAVYRPYLCTLFPSRFEGMGLVVIESMACGVPVLMGRTGIASEVGREFPEMIVEAWSVQKVKNHLQCIAGHREERAKRLRAYVEQHHSMNQFTRSWTDLINIVCRDL